MQLSAVHAIHTASMICHDMNTQFLGGELAVLAMPYVLVLAAAPLARTIDEAVTAAYCDLTLGSGTSSSSGISISTSPTGPFICG